MNKLINTTATATYNVEKVKLNKLPRRFELEGDHRKVKFMSINGQKVKVTIRPEETQYVAFSLTEKNDKGVEFTQHYYVRDHSFFNESAVKTLSKVKVVKAADVAPTA